MALSRFWSWMIAISAIYIFYLLAVDRMYSLNGLVNGKQNDPVLVAELPLAYFGSDSNLLANLNANKGLGFSQNDSIYKLLESGVVEVSTGKQSADGIFPTCKNTIMDIWLPLIGYLTFFCGLLNLLNDSNAIGKLAGVMAPFFTKIFPELPKGHPAYGFMTMNFAANFLGLDNAATPFGLKAMESMQEVNIEKDKASNSQIMFLCLHAAGLTLIPTSIIGYRAAQHASNPADIMLPTIITSFIGTLAALIFVSIKQKINLVNLVVIGLVTAVSA
ncbi:MAG: spore maturation protein, partial [Bacteroidia bacterium]|nr:spore maturation protein [Bacteroidia bacterium]